MPRNPSSGFYFTIQKSLIWPLFHHTEIPHLAFIISPYRNPSSGLYYFTIQKSLVWPLLFHHTEIPRLAFISLYRNPSSGLYFTIQKSLNRAFIISPYRNPSSGLYYFTIQKSLIWPLFHHTEIPHLTFISP